MPRTRQQIAKANVARGKQTERRVARILWSELPLHEVWVRRAETRAWDLEGPSRVIEAHNLTTGEDDVLERMLLVEVKSRAWLEGPGSLWAFMGATHASLAEALMRWPENYRATSTAVVAYCPPRCPDEDIIFMVGPGELLRTAEFKRRYMGGNE